MDDGIWVLHAVAGRIKESVSSQVDAEALIFVHVGRNFGRARD